MLSLTPAPGGAARRRARALRQRRLPYWMYCLRGASLRATQG